MSNEKSDGLSAGFDFRVELDGPRATRRNHIANYQEFAGQHVSNPSRSDERQSSPDDPEGYGEGGRRQGHVRQRQGRQELGGDEPRRTEGTRGTSRSVERSRVCRQEFDPHYERQDAKGRRDEERFHEQVEFADSNERDGEVRPAFLFAERPFGLRLCYIEPFPDFPYPRVFMNLFLLMARHGYALTFSLLLAEAIGLPFPAAIALVAAGAAVAAHALWGPYVLLVAVTALLLGDTVQFWLGRYMGWLLLGILCRGS